MSLRVLKSARFWVACICTAMVASALTGWELGLVDIPGLPVPPRPSPTGMEWLFAGALILLLALNGGLLSWQMRYGHCPRSTRRASGVGAALGAFALLCPVCLALPLGLVGLSSALAILAAFAPIIRIIALLVLTVSTLLLWPRNG